MSEAMIYTSLGNQGSMPTARSGLASGHLMLNGTSILFDCGEGVQRQLRIAQELKNTEFQVDVICITHWHLDHFWGLRPLLESWALMGRVKPLTIMAPVPYPHFEKFQVPYELKWLYAAPMEITGATITPFATRHRVESQGYKVAEKQRLPQIDAQKCTELGLKPGPEYKLLKDGKSVTLPNGRVITSKEVLGEARVPRCVIYTGDHHTNALMRGAYSAIYKNADILVHDTTFINIHELVQRAYETLHSTAKEAAIVANESKVECLVLNHFSERINVHQAYQEAQAWRSRSKSAVLADFEQLEIQPKGVLGNRVVWVKENRK